ncbi:hypothetical protein MLD52_17195 [Puniceicoccaceae bacterium K14]|nr:hypothetical protein [Puniceicoccaceae bacterium K14]
MIKRILIPLAVLSIATLLNAQTPKTIVYPAEAIQDSARLNKAAYDKRYPGIDITGIGLVDIGWYVRYGHEQLTYLFGPFDDLEFARIQKATLEQIRLASVLKSPSLSSSVVDIIRFDFRNFESTDDSENVRSVE